jgi:hypothetical protein
MNMTAAVEMKRSNGTARLVEADVTRVDVMQQGDERVPIQQD